MTIYETIDESQFVQRFDEMNRSENFTIAGRRALFEYLDDMSDDTGQPMELDVIAICCDFAEYADMDEFHRDYDPETWPDLDEVKDETAVIEIPGSDGFIIGPM